MKLSWRGLSYLFFSSTLLENAAQGHLTAFTPLLLHDLGLSPAEVAIWTGLLYTMTMAVALPLTPFWGVLAERYSRRLVIVRSYYLESVAYLLCFLAADIRWLIAARLLLGLTFANVATIMATQAMVTPRQRLGTAVATVQAAQPIAASLGPPLGAVLLPHIGLRGLFLLDAGLTLLAGLLATSLLAEPAASDRSVPLLTRTKGVLLQVWRAPTVRWNFMGSFAARGANTTVDIYLPVRITQVATTDPAVAIGLILGIYGALTAVATWAVGRLVDRVNESRLFWRAMLAGTACAAALASAPTLWLLGVLAALRSVPVAMTNTVLFSHLARVLPPGQQTAVMSLAPLPRTTGALLVPLVAAVVVPLWPGGALAVAGLSYGAATVAGLRMERLTAEASDQDDG